MLDNIKYLLYTDGATKGHGKRPKSMGQKRDRDLTIRGP